MVSVRLKSGVEGLDELIEGGFPKGSNILITGGPGTGKSILGLQFIVYGALNGEPGIYLTVEESRDNVVSQAQQFGWEIEKLEKEKKMMINTIEEYEIGVILDELEKESKQLKARRVVVDSLSMMSIFTRALDKATRTIKPEIDLIHTSVQELSRSQVIGILKKLSKLGTTNLIISEDQETSDKTAEFACDGVIKVQMKAVGKELHRLITVEKMRETKIDGIPHKFDFTTQGIKIVE